LTAVKAEKLARRTIVALACLVSSVSPVGTTGVANALPFTGGVVFAPSWSAYRHHGDRTRASVVPAVAEARLVIDAIGMDMPIYLGDQSTIDRNRATHYDGSGGWRRPVPAGATGTYWLAGHRTSRGTGPFRRVPELEPGDEVRIVTATTVVTYVVRGSTVTGLDASDDDVYGSDPDAPRLLLQTCLPNDERLLVFGERVA
jgi:LPXTG-site transpeptidase (sortase) family protein